MHMSISRLLLLLIGCSGCSGCATSSGTGAADSLRARPELEATRTEVCEPFTRFSPLNWAAPTTEAIRRFQAERGLDSPVLSLAATRELGITATALEDI